MFVLYFQLFSLVKMGEEAPNIVLNGRSVYEIIQEPAIYYVPVVNLITKRGKHGPIWKQSERH